MMQLPCAVNGINKTPGRKKGRKIPIKPNAPSSVPCVLVFLPHFHKFRIPPSWITLTLTAPQGPTRRLSRAVGSFFSALELLWRLTPARRTTIHASRRGGWSIGQPAAQKFIELDPLGCIPAAHEFNQEELKFSFVFWRNNCWSVFFLSCAATGAAEGFAITFGSNISIWSESSRSMAWRGVVFWVVVWFDES